MHRHLAGIAWTTGLFATLATLPAFAVGSARIEVAVAAHAGPQVSLSIGAYFSEQQRLAVAQDHARMRRAGQCPPGLARKGPGCQPPGQVKKAYVIGRPLPSGLVYHALPPALAAQLGPPPAGHRFVRVASDILLIAVDTAMVIDAIEDLGR